MVTSCENKNKWEMNKREKEMKILGAGEQLFVQKGVDETSISDITALAGVAKGTFYLYFHDKIRLLDVVVCRHSLMMLTKSWTNYREKSAGVNADEVTSFLLFVDEIILLITERPNLLKLIYKNISWTVFQSVLEDQSSMGSDGILLKDLTERFAKIFKLKDQRETNQLLFVLLEMTSGVLYSALVLEAPYTIDEIKPELYRSIRSILETRMRING